MGEYKIEEYFEKFPLAMAYVPWQTMDKIYENPEEAIRIGTLFPELCKPFTGTEDTKMFPQYPLQLRNSYLFVWPDTLGYQPV